MMTMEECSVNTWEEFDQELAKLRRDRHKSRARTSTSLLFRGQENSDWLLTTTLDRKREQMLFRGQMLFGDYYRLIYKIRPQVETLTDREWPIPECSKIERLTKKWDFDLLLDSGRCPGYAYMAYLRHHGFPSPLMDWTRSPYIAAYFAFNKAAQDLKGKVSIYVFSEVVNKSFGNKMRVVYRYGPHVKTHRRHMLQQSEYTLCLAFEKEWQFEKYDSVFEQGLHQQGICWKFTIPASERAKVLERLDAHNLNAFSLFGSEEALMETLATREFCFERKAGEAGEVLRNPAKEPGSAGRGLGTEIASLFAKAGLRAEIPELRGHEVNPPKGIMPSPRSRRRRT